MILDNDNIIQKQVDYEVSTYWLNSLKKRMFESLCVSKDYMSLKNMNSLYALKYRH